MDKCRVSYSIDYEDGGWKSQQTEKKAIRKDVASNTLGTEDVARMRTLGVKAKS